jgi:transmembrane sensor
MTSAYFSSVSVAPQYKYRATFRNETLPQILDYLAKSAALKWRTEEAVQQADDTFTKKKIIVDLY